MTSMESDLVAAAARALLDLAPTTSSSSSLQVGAGVSPPQPPPPVSWNYKYKAPMSMPSSSVFRSLAPDVYCSSTTTRRRESIGEGPASPAAVSYSSSSSSSVSVSEDHSMDGYTSETTLLTSHSHIGTNTGGGHLVEYHPRHQQQEHQEEHQEDTFAGTTILLAIEEQDKDSLSPLHCYMRKHCVEAFAATPQDLTIPRYGKSHSGRVRVGQVGIRCQHCKHRPARHRQERAVCFPSSLKNIYHSIETWQRRHSLVCRDLPTKIKMDMMELMKQNRKGAGGRRQYWEESARLLGMETTATGVRFVRTPGLVAGASTTTSSQVQLNTSSPTETMNNSSPIVYPADKALVTNYLYTLMEQMEFTRFTEQDRIGGRSKVKDCPVGLAGMQCKHCRGKAGFGRYFPNTVQALASANSDRNIFNHIDKCRKCPESIRQNLKELHEAQSTEKNKRGQRKQFFERVWARLHGAQPQPTLS